MAKKATPARESNIDETSQKVKVRSELIEINNFSERGRAAMAAVLSENYIGTESQPMREEAVRDGLEEVRVFHRLSK